mgnify:CR=1 FL=1
MTYIRKLNIVGLKIIIAIALSFCGLLGIQMQYLNYTFTGLGKEILLIVFFCTFKMYYRISVKRNVQFYISIVLSVFYAMILEFGFQLDIMSCIQFNINDSSDSAPFGNRNIPFFALYIYYFEQKTIAIESDKKNLKRCFAIIVLFWIMAYLALFPGVYATDAPYWYHEF